MKSTTTFADPSTVTINGVLGQALAASANGRLKWFIQDETCEAIRIYRRDRVKNSLSEGWKGECAGKWLYAASRAAIRTNDPVLKKHLRQVADFLLRQQEPNGYLGTYNEAARFNSNAPNPSQNYDLWLNCWIMQGLVDVHRLFPEKKYLTAAMKLGDLCIATFQTGGRSVVNSGPFGGTGSACVADHFMDLYHFTNEDRYLQFAEYCVAALEKRPGTELISRTLQKYDAAQINEGKHYEMLHCYLGIAKLYQVTGNETYGQVVQNAWEELHHHHENAAGAPAGGVNIHPECYNPRYMFSPYFYSETCSMMDWLRFNIKFLEITGTAKYADEIEKIAYNALLGAQFPDGYGWIYHSIMNGRRSRTSQFACCTSSGAMALEEVPRVIYSTNRDGLQVNLFAPSQASLPYDGRTIQLEQVTDYPFDGKIVLKINPDRKTTFTLRIRIPSWMAGSSLSFNGKKCQVAANTFHSISQEWKKGDVVEIEFPMALRLVHQVEEYNAKGEYIDERIPYCAIYRGPLLYATEWMDALDKRNSILVPANFSVANLKATRTLEGLHGFAYTLKLPGRTHVFVPYFEVANREEDSCHTVWLRMET